MDRLIEDFANSLLLPKDDLMLEYVELGIDSVIDNDFVKSIPIIKTVAEAVKLGQAIYERNLMVQTYIFIRELNTGSIDRHKLIEHQDKLRANPIMARKELERVLLILNRNIEKIKSEIYAKLYMAYVNEKIAWIDFEELCFISERLFIDDYRLLYLRYIDDRSINKYNKTDGFKISRLDALGLIHDDMKFGALYPRGENYNPLHNFQLSRVGELLCDILGDIPNEYR